MSALPLRVVFFGTPEFAASIFEFLLQAKVHFVAIVTQPDRPKGRSLQVQASAVKQCSARLAPQIPIFQPLKASDPIFISHMQQLQADLFVVVAFGQILPQQVLDIPLKGCINVHASLLPKYRGAAPMQRCLMNGEIETGVSIQKMVRQMDAGDVIATAKIEVPQEMTLGELEFSLCELSKPLLLLVLQAYEQGIPKAEPQDHTVVTFAAKVAPEEGEIHWEESAKKIHNQVRAFSPRPGAWCWVYCGSERKRVKILRTNFLMQNGKPGVLLSASGVIGCGSGSLQLIEVQPEGKKPMKGADWLRGVQEPVQFIAGTK